MLLILSLTNNRFEKQVLSTHIIMTNLNYKYKNRLMPYSIEKIIDPSPISL